MEHSGGRAAPRLTGRLAVQRSGVGFVTPDSGRGGDIFVHASNFGPAWHGDRVEVALLPRRGRSREGTITAVLKRGRETITAEIMRAYGRKGWLARPLDHRLDFALLAALPEKGATPETAEMPQAATTGPAHAPRQPAKGDIVLLKPGEEQAPNLWAAEILDNFGPGDDLDAQERIVKAGHGIPTFFPANVLAEAAAVHSSGQAELDRLEELIASGARVDLRHIPFVTIDGEAARDFDDAIYVEERARGFALWVGIADVSHYVRPGLPLDREALGRGNSYYFPQSVEPMLPEALSNDLCSLKPAVPRLAVVAKMNFDRAGKIAAAPEFFVAVIQSRARLTYTWVFSQLDAANQDSPGENSASPAPAPGFMPVPELPAPDLAGIIAMLRRAETLAKLMLTLRREAGSLDFELPEPEARVSAQDGTLSIVAEERNFAHQLIEMFMVAANEAVAVFLARHGASFPYRVHPLPDPDKLVGLFDLLTRTGLTQLDKLMGKQAAQRGFYPGPGVLPGILNAAQGTAAEFVVSRLVLRSMMQARYSLDNDGHFGLASNCYCHFTSPIRRYADLLVHRALKHALATPGFAPLPDKIRLEDMLDIINADEQTAKTAEREILRRMTVLLLRDQVGEVFDGVVSGVTDFGIFVELTETMAEGMIALTSLADDYYDYFPERQELMGRGTRQRFHLGLPLKVRLVEANLRQLEINLELVSGQGRRRAGDRGRDRER